jgi:hypothetical protein
MTNQNLYKPSVCNDAIHEITSRKSNGQNNRALTSTALKAEHQTCICLSVDLSFLL